MIFCSLEYQNDKKIPSKWDLYYCLPLKALKQGDKMEIANKAPIILANTSSLSALRVTVK